MIGRISMLENDEIRSGGAYIIKQFIQMIKRVGKEVKTQKKLMN